MRYLAPALLAAVVTTACAAGHSNTAHDLQSAVGVYKGDFSGSEIQLTLEQIDEHTAVGHSLHKGQRSDMKGSVQPSEHGLHFELKELGNSPYEGVFTFDLDTATLRMQGTWRPLTNKELDVVSYTLDKSPSR
jgi:hypothetical protein